MYPFSVFGSDFSYERYTLERGEMTVRACVPILKGEEITAQYRYRRTLLEFWLQKMEAGVGHLLSNFAIGYPGSQPARQGRNRLAKVAKENFARIECIQNERTVIQS